MQQRSDNSDNIPSNMEGMATIIKAVTPIAMSIASSPGVMSGDVSNKGHPG